MKALRIDLIQTVDGKKKFLAVRFPQSPGMIYIPVDGKAAMVDEPKELVKDREDRAANAAKREQERIDKMERDEAFQKEIAKKRAEMEAEFAKEAQKLGAKYAEPKKGMVNIKPDKPLVVHDYASLEGDQGGFPELDPKSAFYDMHKAKKEAEMSKEELKKLKQKELYVGE